jgi:AcrR family transcriptional regulator
MSMRVNEAVKIETRKALLDAAARAFASDGYHRVNIDRVSQAAGLAKGTVYNYFPSKRAIFDAVLGQACTLAVQSADAVPGSASTAVRLEAFVAGNLAWATDNRALALLLARELIGGDTETRELVLEASAPCIEKVAAILQGGSERGELTLDGPPTALALTFITLANVLLLQASQGPAAWPSVEELPVVATALFLRGLGARP